jgi:hypothetical protein
VNVVTCSPAIPLRVVFCLVAEEHEQLGDPARTASDLEDSSARGHFHRPQEVHHRIHLEEELFVPRTGIEGLAVEPIELEARHLPQVDLCCAQVLVRAGAALAQEPPVRRRGTGSVLCWRGPLGIRTRRSPTREESSEPSHRMSYRRK